MHCQLDETKIGLLAQSVAEFYESRISPPAVDGHMYSGGWIAGNSESQEARQYLLNSLQYYPKIVVHDPLADWYSQIGIVSGHRRLSGARVVRCASMVRADDVAE